MKQSPPTLQDNYQYDALDRLTTRNATHRFYQDDRIAIEVEGAITRRFIAFDAQPLAVQQAQTTTLLATDRQTSVLQQVSAAGTQACAYTPYGHHPAENGITQLVAFNGEHPEAVTGHYLLGQGYRAYNPVLMRFNSPDSWSPFGKGGINAYAYCDNDPRNKVDPSGHVGNLLKGIKNIFGRKTGIMRATELLQEKGSTELLLTGFKNNNTLNMIEEDFFPAKPIKKNIAKHLPPAPPKYKRTAFNNEIPKFDLTVPPPSYQSATSLPSYQASSSTLAPRRTDIEWSVSTILPPRGLPAEMTFAARLEFEVYSMHEPRKEIIAIRQNTYLLRQS